MNFFRKEELLFVIAHDQSIPERIISCLLEDISQKFLSKYKDFLHQGPLSDTYLFQGFKDDFHAVLKKYKRMEDLPVFWGDLKKFRGLEKEIFALCDGTRTIGEIAKELGKVYFDVMRIIVTHKEKLLRIITKSRWVLE